MKTNTVGWNLLQLQIVQSFYLGFGFFELVVFISYLCNYIVLSFVFLWY